ncbi:MAG: RNA polymerase sigma factor [Planctomycetota bacterium]
MIAFDPNISESEWDTDTECMIRVASGDREAFNELVSRHFPSTVRIISAMMGNSANAEDLAQDVFVRVYRSRQRYVPTARFTTWLGTITRNVVLNAKRSLSRQRVYATQFSDDHESASEQVATVPSPSFEVDYAEILRRRETVAAVQEAVDQLPSRQRQAMELVHFQGMPYIVAAEEMETTRKAIKSLLGRGRVSLKQILERHETSIE